MTSVETGNGADALDRRPQLAAALDRAEAFRCPVVVSKLDRLSRDVAFISSLMARKVVFVAAELSPGRSVHAPHLCRRNGPDPARRGSLETVTQH
jgi:hypothetical protein